MAREHGNTNNSPMRLVRQNGAPMNWSIKVGDSLLYREGEPFLFFWEDVASQVWDRECLKGNHTEPVSLCFKGEPVRTYYPKP